MFSSELNQVPSPRFCRIAVDEGKVSSLNAFKPYDCCSVGENSAAASRACEMPRGSSAAPAVEDGLDLVHSLVWLDPNLSTV